MIEPLYGRAEELASLVDLIRTSVSLADSAIPQINQQLRELAELGVDNLELEGPPLYSRTASPSPAFDERRVVYAAALLMPGGLGYTSWDAEDYAARYGTSHCEPPCLRERFMPFAEAPAIVRAALPAHTPKLIAQLLQCFAVLTR